MDISRGFEETGQAAAPDEEPVMERPPEIGVDERRMHVRAYNYWVSLSEGEVRLSSACFKSYTHYRVPRPGHAGEAAGEPGEAH